MSFTVFSEGTTSGLVPVQIAASVAGVTLTIKPSTEANVGYVVNPKDSVVLALPTGDFLFDVPSIVLFLLAQSKGAKADLTSVINVVQSVRSSDFTSQLESVGSKAFLVGDSLSAADVIAWSHITSTGASSSLKPNGKRWYADLSKRKEFAAAASAAPGAPAASAGEKKPAAPKDKKAAPAAAAAAPAPKAAEKKEAGEQALPVLPAVTPEQVAVAEQSWREFKDDRKFRTAPQHPILPKDDKENILITSALPYVNNVPHLGNVVGCVLSADVYARYARATGKNVLFVCGTDEYGTATETKALAEGVTPRAICDKYHVIHKDVYDWFNISFDKFGRTTTDKQTEIAQDIFWKCYHNGYVIQKPEEQWYCTSCQQFLADRFVEGICPECNYDDARGDQCDECGKPLHAKDLKSPRCKYSKTCGKTPELRTSTHLYLSLDKLQKANEEFVDASNAKCAWSTNALTITKGWFATGLDPRAITRDLKWGTPVPLEGFTNKVFYVWFDAPIGYISITANYTDEWRKWWHNPENVKLYQFMAKDNVPFHSIIFPCSLLGTKEPYTMLHHLSATEYLNYENQGFSKSRGIGVFGDNAQESGIDSDVYRFYLMYIRPESSDANFDWNDLIVKHNSELLNNLGNFVHRALTFLTNNFGGVVPKVLLEKDETAFIAAVNQELAEYNSNMSRVKLRDSIRYILNISRIGNQFIQTMKPWVLLKENKEAKAGSVLAVAANVIYLLALLLEPFLPTTSSKLLSQLMARARPIPAVFLPFLEESHMIGSPEPLFARIDEAMATEWRSKYGGKQEAKEKPKVNIPAYEAGKASREAINQLSALADEQGEKVRTMKASGADKALIKVEVDLLLEFKKHLALATGQPLPSAAPAPKKEGDDKGKGKAKEADKADKAPAEKKGKKEAPKATGELAEKIDALGVKINEQAAVAKELRNGNKAEYDAAMAILEDYKNQRKALVAQIPQ